ncbi:hypothetical protein GCM10028803_14000 [Larkinella knui]|uniref:FecR protein domain-containing protein n=1 Tax=Larkinella knui TaxID=2025310 RepID=A0A3P1CCV8_9BACT|nr:FecR domain-containing protein [Larkinella knui]RRB10654.1 hypothetical protein EHT87_26195 [Larkinella knui]
MEELLVKYTRNECSPEEEQWVIGWLQNPDNESRLRGLMRKQWSNPSVSGVESPDWQRIWLDISRQTKDLPAEPEPPLYRTVWRQIARIAIWVGCIIAFGLTIRFLRQANLPADVIYQSAVDQSMRVELTDHSTVILNKNSTLKVSSDWSGPNRSIWLNGEALITVAEQPNGFRFLIYTADHVVTEVQKARLYVGRHNKKNRVVVEQGLASFIIHYSDMLGEMKKYNLQQGEMAEYDEKSTQLIRRQVNPFTYTAWAKK